MTSANYNLVSQRGVVFFRAQDELTNDLQKVLVQRLGELSGKPKDSGLHVHPVLNAERDGGGSDPEISTISSEQFKKLYKTEIGSLSPKKQSAKSGWHSDITFEPVPSDYTALRLTKLPETGGGLSMTPEQRRFHGADILALDTLWASGYEIFDRISLPYQEFLQSLTATFAQPMFNRAADEGGFSLYEQPRGSPANIGSELKAIHPVVRTNPVTGWKSIFAVGGHCQHVNGISEDESKQLLDWFLKLVVENHDLQARLKWQSPNDLAIWDNRSVFHTATYDYDGERFGNRAVGVGEKPFYDPASKSRRETLLERQ